MSDIERTSMPEPARRIEIFTGAGRRLTWPAAAKAKIVTQIGVEGASMSAVARRHGLTPDQLFAWRREAHRAATPSGFVPVVSETPLLVRWCRHHRRRVAGAGRAQRLARLWKWRWENHQSFVVPARRGHMRRDTKLTAIFMLATALTASWSALASVGCSAFNGRADDQTKGEGGSRVGAGFSKGDTLAVTIHEATGQTRATVSLLEYSSPDGPFHALVEDTADSFIYAVPARTSDYIYLNFGGPWPGMIVTWGCTPASSGTP